MSFTRLVWDETRSLYDAILAMPFNKELADGTLDPARFAFYVQQDSLYLVDYARALALLAAKAPNAASAELLLGYAKEGIEVERALHDHFYKTFNITPAERQEPACFSYTQFLLACTPLDPYPVGLAAMLPCFWIYREVGLDIARRARSPNPYSAWIETYSDDGFGKAVAQILELTDAAADSASERERAAMRETYATSMKCEWRFWDGAYRMERWPI